MEQPTEHDHERGTAGPPAHALPPAPRAPRSQPRPEPGPPLEGRLRQTATGARIASGDLTLFALQASQVLARLRELDPELVAFAESEVAAAAAWQSG